MAYGESKDRVIDDVTGPERLSRDPIRLEPNISKTAEGAIWQQSLFTR